MKTNIIFVITGIVVIVLTIISIIQSDIPLNQDQEIIVEKKPHENSADIPPANHKDKDSINCPSYECFSYETSCGCF